MSPKAPHLPAKTCSVQAHKQWNGLKWVVLISVLSVVAGATAAIVMMSWFFPVVDMGRTVYLGQKSNITAAPVLDASFEGEIQKRMMRVYKGALEYDSVYAQNAEMGSAMMLSSDGWAVLYFDGAVVPKAAQMQGVDYQGVLHDVEQVVPYVAQNALFIKFSGNDYLVSSFSDWDQHIMGEYVWSVNGSWDPVIVKMHKDSTEVVSVTSDLDSYIIEGEQSVGEVVLDQKGRFLGFVHTNATIQRVWPVEFHLPSVLANGELEIVPFSLKGRFVEGYVDSTQSLWRQKSAFLVTSVRGMDGLSVGDLVLSLNGASIKPRSFARMIMNAPEEFTLEVLRDGSVVEVQITRKP